MASRGKALLTIGGTLTLSGCIDSLASSPDPVIISTDEDFSLGGLNTIYATIENTGDAGDITVTFQYLDRRDTVINDRVRTFHFRSGERKRVSATLNAPSDATSRNVIVEW